MLKSILAVGVALAALGGVAHAQGYPNKPVRFISAYAPGGGAEVGLRLLGAKLQEAGWPSVVIENRPGGGGAVGALATLQSAADGYTIFQCDATSFAINVTLMKQISYDPLKDFVPIMMTFSFPSVLVVHASSPAKTVDDLVKMAKSKQGGIAYASQGIGSGGHLLGHMFQNAVGTPLTHAPYKGSGAAMPDVIAGRVDLIFASYGSVKSHLQAGTLRALAVTSKKRMAELPDVPTMTEAKHPDVFFDVWFGLCAPAATPPDAIKAVHDKVQQVITQPDTVKRMADTGLYVETNTPEQFRAQIRSETDRLGKVIKDAGVTPQ